MKVYLVRHGESESNAGLPTDAPHLTKLTSWGHEQAEWFTTRWIGTRLGVPQLIVTSPFLRTKETAAPFLKVFQGVAHEEWPVQEFTQLEPSNWKGTTHKERGPKVREYWERAEPFYLDGPGAERFVDFFGRVFRTLLDLEKRDEQTIVIFTHCHFIQAFLWTLMYRRYGENHWKTPSAMREFDLFTRGLPVANGTAVPLTVTEDLQWSIGGFGTV